MFVGLLTTPPICTDSQVLENARRKSVEGLSLPFLTSWFLGASRLSQPELNAGLIVDWDAGDLTNLVGCILTHQLPFQVRCHCSQNHLALKLRLLHQDLSRDIFRFRRLQFAGSIFLLPKALPTSHIVSSTTFRVVRSKDV